MRRTFELAWVIARRDFIATVVSRSYILFLLAPLLALGFGILIGELTKQTDQAVTQPTIAVVSDARTAGLLREARERVAAGVGGFAVPLFRTVDAEADRAAQARRLIASDAERVSGVLTGDLAAPRLIAPQGTIDAWQPAIGLIVEDAQRRAAAEEAGLPAKAAALATEVSGQSAGNLSRSRHGLARGGQMLIFTLTLILAGWMLSNLVEEKSNKVIEVLAAAAPLDAVFLGKLIGMLGVSLVGITIWGSLAGIGLYLARDAFGGLLSPAVGWPAYALLAAVYFAVNYMLLGTVFLGVGAQASNVREVQTLSMPITFVQVGLIALASAAVSPERGALFWIATVFPLSSPLAMIAVAAQSGALWPHLLALAWQGLWIAILIRVTARLFRRNVMKSGRSGEPLFAVFGRGR